MIFAFISMTAMFFIRNSKYVETKVGQQILDDHKGFDFKERLKKGMYKGTLKHLSSGIFTPFFSTLLADISEGKERAGIYALINTITAVLSVIIGSASGFIYAADPRYIFYLTASITALCAIGVILFLVQGKKQKSAGNTMKQLAEGEKP